MGLESRLDGGLDLLHAAGRGELTGGNPFSAVLRSATLEAVTLLGVDEQLGTIAEGKLADLVVLGGDPYAFDGIGDRVEQVWKGGERYSGV